MSLCQQSERTSSPSLPFQPVLQSEERLPTLYPDHLRSKPFHLLFDQYDPVHGRLKTDRDRLLVSFGIIGQGQLSDLHSLCIETTPPNPKILNFNPPTSSNLLVASSITCRFLTSYSFVLNFSKTRISSINPQMVKTGTGNVIAPDNKCGN